MSTQRPSAQDADDTLRGANVNETGNATATSEVSTKPKTRPRRNTESKSATNDGASTSVKAVSHRSNVKMLE